LTHNDRHNVGNTERLGRKFDPSNERAACLEHDVDFGVIEPVLRRSSTQCVEAIMLRRVLIPQTSGVEELFLNAHSRTDIALATPSVSLICQWRNSGLGRK
jgi:hypothetical protein